MSLAVTGLDNQVSAAFGDGASPASAQVRLWDVATMGSSCRFRRRHPGRRRTSIPRAFGLMTDPACGFSTRCTPARCGLASVRATIRPRELSRIDVELPSMRRERTPDSAEATRWDPALARRRPRGARHPRWAAAAVRGEARVSGRPRETQVREHVAAVRTLLARMNVRVPVVSWLLGHSDVRTTLHYAHLADKETEAASEWIGIRAHAVEEFEALWFAPTALEPGPCDVADHCSPHGCCPL